MPLTLYWYILRDLLKLLITSTLVLVIVMSFGFAIKPISDGLLGPWQLVKVIGYTMPGMLVESPRWDQAARATHCCHESNGKALATRIAMKMPMVRPLHAQATSSIEAA